MGMVTLHLVVGVGIFILPLFLLLFSLVAMSLAHLYIVIGSVSFVVSVITAIILVTKFVNQPEAHGFFAYSDVIASALMSLGLLLDGILYLLPDYDTPCYHYKVVYGFFIVPMITSFYSILGMSIERFQTFALYRDRRKFTKKFSIAWFLASWTLALCFLVILLAQISDKEVGGSIGGVGIGDGGGRKGSDVAEEKKPKEFFVNIVDIDLFPGPHSEKRPNKEATNDTQNSSSEVITLTDPYLNASIHGDLETNESSNHSSSTRPPSYTGEVECAYRYSGEASPDSGMFKLVKVPCNGMDWMLIFNGTEYKGEKHVSHCRISSKPFIMYYLILIFLLCFVTPVLITTSLNVFIHSAVQYTTYEVISHHQWLTLSACIVMWGPSLIERLLSKWDIVSAPLVVSVFLFLLGHTHNVLRSVLHAVFAQQIHSITWQGNQLSFTGTRVRFGWGHPRENKVKPSRQKSSPQLEERDKSQTSVNSNASDQDNGIEIIETSQV